MDHPDITTKIKRRLESFPPVVLAGKVLENLRDTGFRATFRKARNKLSNHFNAGKQAVLYRKRDLAAQRAFVFPQRIRFSIVVPLFNTPEEFLRGMIESVLSQTYADWELCMADGSDAVHGEVGRICAEYTQRDSRIRYRRLESNRGISGNTNAALEMVTGDYIALLDHDDLLAPAALYEVMRVICGEGADFIYTDETLFRRSPSDACLPHLKPDFAPDTLRANNYICHLTVFRKTLYDAVGGFDPQCDGSQDYDMVLRLTERAERIAHIPRILYYWRVHAGSVADNIGAKPYVIEAAHRALRGHLERTGLRGEVLDTVVPSIYRIRYELIGQPKVSIIIPVRDHAEALKTCVRSVIERSTYRHFEIIVADNGSTEPEALAYLDALRADERIRVIDCSGAFNYSAINNRCAAAASGEYLLLLNNDTEVITPSWIEEMLMFAQRSDVGAVGAKLYYPDGTVQHAGVGIGLRGLAAHLHRGFEHSHVGYMGRLIYAQDLSAVTGACVMIPKRVWEQVGGLDESYAVTFNDIDLCMRIRKAGLNVVWTPFAELYHFEAQSRGADDTPEKQARFQAESERFAAAWSRELACGDPYFGPGFSRENGDFILAPPRIALEQIAAREQAKMPSDRLPAD